jgi:hypothetical protein
VDCTSFGAGSCSTTYGACNAIGAGTCDAGPAITCNGSVATGCPSGVPETVDCNALTGGNAGLGLACDPNASGRGWDVSRACSNGACGLPVDACSSGVLTSCVRGATVSVDCRAVGLGDCTLNDASARAQCGAPAGD